VPEGRGGPQNENEIENEYAYEIMRFSYALSFSISVFSSGEEISAPHATAVWWWACLRNIKIETSVDMITTVIYQME